MPHQPCILTILGVSDIFLQCWLIIFAPGIANPRIKWHSLNTARRGGNPTRGALKQNMKQTTSKPTSENLTVTGQMELWIVWFHQQNRGRKCFKMRLCYFPQFLLWTFLEMNFNICSPFHGDEWVSASRSTGKWLHYEKCGEAEVELNSGSLWGPFGWVKNQALKHSCVC